MEPFKIENIATGATYLSLSRTRHTEGNRYSVSVVVRVPGPGLHRSVLDVRMRFADGITESLVVPIVIYGLE